MTPSRKLLDTVMNTGLVVFTMLGFLLTSMKLPEYGLISNLVSEIFWVYSAYRSWKEANQIGILITTVMITGILIWGVINYWFL
jgi:hypothetical protein